MNETVELVTTQFEKVVQSPAYTCVVLKTDEKRFAIYTDPASGKTMQMHLAGTEKTRPNTHDLLNKVFQGLEIKVKHIVIYELEDTLYFARLFLEQQRGDMLHIVEIDARPSDCITVALLNKAPVYCSRDVLSRAIPYEE